MSWKLEGTYMESCNCDAICPCIMLNTPTKGEYSVLIVWQINKGSDDNIDLSGLNVALLVYSPGKMHETPWDVAVYIDSKAKEDQKSSLLKIFGGKAGGHPAALAEMIGNIIGVADANIEFNKQGKNYTVKIADVADVELETLEGQGGGNITVSNHPFAVAPGYSAVVGKAKKSRIKAYDWDWNFDGQQCMYSQFAYEG
jgi:hypothetical protein